MHAQLIARLESFAQADFQEILRERKVIENLNALEELIADAKRRKAAWEEAHPDGDVEGEERIPGHLQPPDKLLEAHLKGTLEAARGKLNAREQTLQGRNEVLFDEVKQQWKEIEELTKGVEVLAEDVVGAGELMDEAGM